MSEREQLMLEIAKTPDSLVREVLNFLLFIKAQRNQDNFPIYSSETREIPSFLNFIDQVNSEIPPQENTQLPKDLSKNIDHYLYGSSKQEE